MIRSVEYAVKTPAHINELVTVADKMLAAAFIVHMSSTAFNDQKRFAHMYEWGRVGDPNARLWKHRLRGTGAARVATFDFKASQKAVPVSPEKRAVGVQSNHIFVWKAPVLELGRPVKIYPKIATTMVIDTKSGGIVYSKKTINIPRQGDPQVWNAFTNEYMAWYISPVPNAILASQLSPRAIAGVKSAVGKQIKRMGSNNKVKTLKITPAGIDKSFSNTLIRSLNVSYIEGARNRRVDS